MKNKKVGRPQYQPNLWYYLPEYYCRKGSQGIFIRTDKLLKQRKLSGQAFVGTRAFGPLIDSQKYGHTQWVGMWWPIQRLLVLPIDAPSPIPCDQELSEFLQTTIAAARLREDMEITSTEERKLKKLMKIHVTRMGERGEYVRS